MAKKNRKNSKINQKIRKYFDDDPFDVGILRVSTQTLSELFNALGIYDIDNSRDILIKTARMMWSEAENDFRLDILNFFANEGKIYKATTPKEPNLDRDEKIEALIAELDVTHQERVLLHDAFADVRSKKITIEKMESKLRHIRYSLKKERVQKRVGGVFDIEDSLEFNASIHYVLYAQSFHKILTLNTKNYDYDYFRDSDEKQLIEEILEEKERVVTKKQKEVEAFIKNLKNPHPYMTQKEIATSLRASPPKTKLSYPLIKESVLLGIIKKVLGDVEIELHDEELLIRLQQSCKLPQTDKSQSYILELHVELNSLLEDIWKANELDFNDALNESREELEKQFLNDLKDIVEECGSYATLLRLSDDALYAKVYDVLLEIVPISLNISPKIARKCVRRFVHSIHEEIAKKQRYELLARTIREFKNLFPLARDMRRKLTLHIGPTNSGKTYQAMQKLKNADTGYYLAPLRLLALEGYEDLKESGIEASLITGEEQIIDEDATHISSTIEMLNFDVDVDVCVIDEVQMIDDRDRGWAWANAIIGAPAKEIIMTGSPNAKEAVIALAEYLGEELEIIEFKRKNPLTLLSEPTPEKSVEPNTAIIAFSRKDVLKLKHIFSKYFNVSVVYGNLSPEVRREEARRFRTGETQILVATDAIAMGLNMPIKTILFSKAEKFDGVSDRSLLPSEIHQISGRAGRYGMHENGYVGALSGDVLNAIKKNFNKEAKAITIPFKVMANLDHIKLVGTILEENSLHEILKFFVKNMEFDGPFIATNLDDMLEVSILVDSYDLDIATKYHLACAPLTLKSPYIIAAYESYLGALEKKMPIPYIAPPLSGSYAQTTDELLRAEDMVKEISLYLWLSYRFSDYFVDVGRARAARGVLNKFIENSLQQSQLATKCRMCNAPLPPNSPYGICQSCFKKNYAGRGISSRGYRKR
ncbi:helicase-related protein [Sulfurimonas sp.]|uniref:helicase-related protein n=1 Tax=Sulfurimonas sp. TaxID=2022749 RepID=UPI0025E3A38B|nr:helicase-related protein [Sulfurimonas sp.]MCK9453743.1 helicase [Sulfurimonas sp.]